MSVEFSIPMLLIFSRTRVIGVLLGTAFHIVLGGILGHYDFSSVAFACYILFLPHDFRISDAFLKSQNKFKILHSRAWFFASTGLTIISVYFLHSVGESHVFRFIALIYGIALFVAIYKKARDLSGYDYNMKFFMPTRRAHYLVLALMVLNGASPYLGLKTESSFSMYSNLRTEGGKSNHLFIPHFQAFNFQKKIVKIISSTDKALQRLAEQKKSMVYHAFKIHVQKRYQARMTNFRVIYSIDGQVNEIASVDDMRKLGAEVPFLFRKVAHFKTIPSDPSACTH
jgi:mRNA-degrading endonuclease RelE of RelBE toxin-antitoxin system